MSSFSLAFPVIRLIHEHHTRPAENRLLRFGQQQLLDRILGASLSALALLDVAYHLSAFAIKSIKAPVKAIFHKEKLSFQEALIHLKIAALFRSTVLFGSLYYFVSPSSISTLFKNPLSTLVKGLLLSGCPEVFIDHRHPDGVYPDEIGGIMNHVSTFMALVDKLSPEIKESMRSTISLLKESVEFGHAPLDFRVNEFTLNTLYKSWSELLEKYMVPADASFKDKLAYGTAVRIISVFFSLISVPLVISELLIRLPSGVLISCLETFRTLMSNQESELVTSLWLFKLNLISIVRLLLAIPLCATLGLYDPKKIQFLFSPLYLGDEKTFDDSCKKLLSKIKQLPSGKSVFIPMVSESMDHGAKEKERHAFCILITKLKENYRLSIINRGKGTKYHPKRDEESRDVDFSWDNIDISFLDSYLHILTCTNIPRIQEIREECLNGMKLLKLFNANQLTTFVYDFVLLQSVKFKARANESGGAKQFESHHHKRLQRIGNCPVSSLLGAISFHSSMHANNMQDKRKYKKFVYALKKNVFKDHGYLLDFDLAIKKDVRPADVVKQALKKTKEKLKPKLEVATTTG